MPWEVIAADIAIDLTLAASRAAVERRRIDADKLVPACPHLFITGSRNLSFNFFDMSVQNMGPPCENIGIFGSLR